MVLIYENFKVHGILAKRHSSWGLRIIKQVHGSFLKVD